MKFVSKNKLSLIVLFLILAVAGGFYFYKVKSENFVAQENKVNQEQTGVVKDASSGKGDDREQEASEEQQKAVVQNTPTTLSDVSLTVYLNKEAVNTGSQTIPKNAVTLYFYPPGGIYNIEKKTSLSWSVIARGQSYPGHGGLPAPYMVPNEDNVSYRVVSVDNAGKILAYSKIFVVKRSEITDWVKTYN